MRRCAHVSVARGRRQRTQLLGDGRRRMALVEVVGLGEHARLRCHATHRAAGRTARPHLLLAERTQRATQCAQHATRHATRRATSSWQNTESIRSSRIALHRTAALLDSQYSRRAASAGHQPACACKARSCPCVDAARACARHGRRCAGVCVDADPPKTARASSGVGARPASPAGRRFSRAISFFAARRAQTLRRSDRCVMTTAGDTDSATVLLLRIGANRSNKTAAVHCVRSFALFRFGLARNDYRLSYAIAAQTNRIRCSIQCAGWDGTCYDRTDECYGRGV